MSEVAMGSTQEPASSRHDRHSLFCGLKLNLNEAITWTVNTRKAKLGVGHGGSKADGSMVRPAAKFRNQLAHGNRSGLRPLRVVTHKNTPSMITNPEQILFQ
jgi:hypothetical protein